MKTYFARHTRKLYIDEDTRRMLWESRRIAIHYPDDKNGLPEEDNSSTNPDDYKGSGRKALRALVEIADNGGYVCAQHHGYDEVQIGKVKPGSKIELLYGKWGPGFEGRTAILKSLQLLEVKLVKPSDYASILVGRPRQGTLMRWPSAGALIENLVENKINVPELASLSFDQQEILCSEFLRLPEAVNLGLPTLANLILPVGRTMKDLDLIALATDGKPIFAQVTYSDVNQVDWKLKRLLKYSDPNGCHLLLFCNSSEIIHRSGVTIIPLERVFKLFTETESGSKWLSYALRKMI
jgi:hypothetical protein